MLGTDVETLSEFANRHKVSLGCSRNVLKLVCGDGCTSTYPSHCTLKMSESHGL